MKETLHGMVTWPDATGSHRLVDALDKLEQHMANLHALSGSPNKSLSASSEVTRLKQENEALKRRTQSAILRLDTLMEQLQPLLEEETAAGTSSNPTNPAQAA